jgi:hypothetical protein
MEYQPAAVETDIFKHLGSLGYNTQNNASGCQIWHATATTTTATTTTNSTTTGRVAQQVSPPLLHIADQLHQFRYDLQVYNKLVQEFPGVPDLRHRLDDNNPRHNDRVCQEVDLFNGQNGGLGGNLFHNQLSFSRSGYIEPLIPPLRHPEFCFNESYLIDLTYLVHDFGTMCRTLKKTSRIVLVDMGASLSFHEESLGGAPSPTLHLIRLFRKFGFPVDHVYAYEVTPTPPESVFDAVPLELMPAFHWINVGVQDVIGGRRNPFTHIINEYTEDDFIMVKLDIDTPWLESNLSEQLNNSTLGKLIDQFYFEKHCHLTELAEYWGDTMVGSVMETLMFFYHLRLQGIPAHFWV